MPLDTTVALRTGQRVFPTSTLIPEIVLSEWPVQGRFR